MNNKKYCIPVTEGTGDAPQRSECIKSKGFIDLELDNTKGSLWLLANWHDEQKDKADYLAPGSLHKFRTLDTIGEARCPSRECQRFEST